MVTLTKKWLFYRLGYWGQWLAVFIKERWEDRRRNCDVDTLNFINSVFSLLCFYPLKVCSVICCGLTQIRMCKGGRKWSWCFLHFWADVVSKFLNGSHDLDLICRAHQVWNAKLLDVLIFINFIQVYAIFYKLFWENWNVRKLIITRKTRGKSYTLISQSIT